MSEPLSPGDTPPGFSLTSEQGNQVALSDYAGHRVIVYFYPAAGTPGCTTQACDFRDNLSDLSAAGLSVLGISPDSPEKLACFRDEQGLTFPLLSDPDRSVMQAWGAYGEKQNYGTVTEGVIRSTFVVEPDGTVGAARYNVRAKGHVDRLRREVGV
jgi:peroxiredoxin Q/BCP